MRYASLLLSLIAGRAAAQDWDVVVYGGTSAGVVAAVQAAHDGLRVVLVEPSQHVGGMTVSGLGATDVGNQQAIGGLARQFYRDLRTHYATPEAWTRERASEFGGRGHRAGDDTAWTFEPHVAEATFARWLRDAEVEVRRGARLRLRDDGVEKDGTRITAIHTVDGARIAGRMFVDATYEGDLLAWAGVSFTVGREANATYGETLNGVQTRNATKHQFRFDVDPYVEPGRPESGLLPGIVAGGAGQEGAADAKIQAYCLRLCATDDPDNRRPWPKPAIYDPLHYELLLRHFDAGDDEIPWNPVRMPNRKTDSNNNKAVSSDWIGHNWGYPTGDWATRDAITAAHRTYTAGLLWTLANHPRVPDPVRRHFQEWGLAKDEFTDNDNWPHQLYVREARRMVSELVMNENHCSGRQPVTDPVGMGAYNMDSHNVQRYVDDRGFVRNEGDVQVRTPPYGVSWRAIRPRRAECTNLLVPTCLSASHIAFGSIRMEPVFMVLGQSAAVAAALALQQERAAVQDVPYGPLRDRLLELGQVLELPDEQRAGLDPARIDGLVIDDPAAQRSGAWFDSTSQRPFVGTGYLHDGNQGKGNSRLRFEFVTAEAGRFAVQLAYTPHQNRARSVPVLVEAGDSTTLVQLDQSSAPADGGLWHTLGTYFCDEGSRIAVTVSNEDTAGYVVVDAVRALPVK